MRRASDVAAAFRAPESEHGFRHRVILIAAARERMGASRLFPFECVFDAANGVLNLALDLVGLALRLQLCVTDRLADRLLHRAFDLLRRSDDTILVHDFLLENPMARIDEIAAL